MKKAVFLDRDGTLIEEREYLSKPDLVVLYPGVGAALARLKQAGFRLVIVSNQSGVGRGLFTMEDVTRVNMRMKALLAVEGVHLDKIYVAPEAPDQPSRARKPSPQFLLDARDEMEINLAESFMIGDKLIDLECGWNAGVKRCILVKTGYGKQFVKEALGVAGNTMQRRRGWQPALIVDDLPAAADWILQQAK